MASPTVAQDAATRAASASTVVWIPMPEAMAFDGDAMLSAGDRAPGALWCRLSGAWLRLCRHGKAA